jgi:hypothetical protein
MTKEFVCLTVVMGCSFIDKDLNIGCWSFFNEDSSNAALVSPFNDNFDE